MSMLKLLLLQIWKGAMNLIYFFCKLAPTRDKITMLSRQTDGDNLDFTLLARTLKEQHPRTRVVIMNRRLEHDLPSMVRYQFHMFRQMAHIAGSRVVILDSYCIAISILHHKPSLQVVQMWHALGSLKKFGYSSLDREEGRDSRLARVMDMHRRYNYIITSSATARDHFMDAFHADAAQMRVIGLPRIDYLTDEANRRAVCDAFRRTYPEAGADKQCILYAPTNDKSDEEIAALAGLVDHTRFDLLVKLHSGREIFFADGQTIRRETAFRGVELLHVADHVITDYSAIVFEAAIAKKPLYFYVPDYDAYMNRRGVYIDYKAEMPGVIATDGETIIRAIEQGTSDPARVAAFAARYVTYRDGSVCPRLCAFLNSLLTDPDRKETPSVDQADL